jgi:hypothetical protein
METVISKNSSRWNSYRWIAETVVRETSAMRVVVVTQKGGDGLIATTAQVKRAGSPDMLSMRMELGKGTATKKAVERQHNEALLRIDDVIKQAKLSEEA